MDINIVYHHHQHHHHHHCHLFNNDYTTFSTVNVGRFFRFKMDVVCVWCMLVCVCMCARVHMHMHTCYGVIKIIRIEVRVNGSFSL